MKAAKDEGAVEIHRERFIYDGVLYERFTLTNYFPGAVNFRFAAALDADFQDMFIVRKYRSGEVGAKRGQDTGYRNMSIRYRGADDIVRETRIAWDRDETSADAEGNVQFSIRLEPQETERICFFITPVQEPQCPSVLAYDEALEKLEASYERWYEETSRIRSDSDVFDGLFLRGAQDLRMLMTDVAMVTCLSQGCPGLRSLLAETASLRPCSCFR